MRRRLTALAAMMALALTLAFGAPASAQDDPTEVPAAETTTDAVDDTVDDATGAVDDATDTVDEETDDSGRWGLLGLLGLAGLAGLLKRPTRTVVEPVATRVTDVRTDTTDRR